MWCGRTQDPLPATVTPEFGVITSRTVHCALSSNPLKGEVFFLFFFLVSLAFLATFSHTSLRIVSDLARGLLTELREDGQV